MSEAVSQAAEHVLERRIALEEAGEQHGPRPRGPLYAVVLTVLAVVLVWNVIQLTRPPALPPPAIEAQHLRYFVADAAQLVEDFRAVEGRLPTRSDLGDLLDEEISYAIQGGDYTLSAVGERVSVAYDSRESLDDWLALGGER